jgi:hypothetical protein
VQDLAHNIALARIGDGHRLAVVARHGAGVACLAAAERIENRAIENDAALADFDYLGRGRAQIGVVAKQKFGVHVSILGPYP